MPISRKSRGEGNSANRLVFRTSFVRHVHEILKMGYDLLDVPSCAKHDEEEITGELVLSMQSALQDRMAPKWAKNFWPVEEIRVNDPGRLGKRRLRIDIEIVKMQHGPRPRFRFEAKRLRDAASRREYLGDEGLGCFLDGRYAREDDEAGMLGYVQSDSIESHVEEFEKKFSGESEALAVEADCPWQSCRIVDELTSFKTKHRRAEPLSAITLFHTLLRFF